MHGLRYIILLLVVLAIPLSFGTDVGTCTVISSSGEYNLTANLEGAPVSVSVGGAGANGASQECIVIASANVTLDCNGHTITNNGTADAAGILVNSSSALKYTNVTIRNCPGVSGYENGIFLYSTTLDNVINVTSYNNTPYGIHSLGSTDIILANNTAYENSAVGIRTHSSSNCTITNNTLHSNARGARLEYTTNSTLLDNVAYNNSNDGFFLDTNPTHHNTLINNTAYNNTDYGIYSYHSSNNTIANNTAHDNGGIGIYLWGGGASENNVTGNTAYRNGDGNPAWHDWGHGISLYAMADRNSISGNTLYNNSLNGIYIYSSGHNNVTENTIYNNSQHGIHLYYDYYCWGNNLSGNNVSNNTQTGIYAEDACEVTLSGNRVHNNSQRGICLDTSHDSSLTGNTVYGNGQYGVCLTSNSDNNTLTGNTAYDNPSGIILRYTCINNTLTSNTAYGNADGFTSEYGGYNNTFTSNTAYDNTDDGFYFHYSSDNTLTSNTAYDNTDDGFYLYYSSFNNVLTGNTAYGNSGEGFHFYSKASYTTFTSNTAYGNAQCGIYMSQSTGNAISGSTLYGNLYSLYANDSNYTMETTRFLNSAGSTSAYTSLSIDDVLGASEEYSINWSASPASLQGPGSFRNKYVNISAQVGTPSIDTIAWNWLDSESAEYVESSIQLWKYNSSGWTLLNNTPDVSSNLLRQYAMSPASIYGLFGNQQEDEGGDPEEDECETHSDCPECYRCVRGECKLPAGSCASASDCSGEYPFYKCEDCTCIGYDCNTDADCPGEGYTCGSGECVPPECTMDENCAPLGEGYACENYECIPPECTMDEDCPGEGETCEDYECIPPECFSDDDCGEGGMCEDYECVPWKCFTSADCEEGFVCLYGVCTPEEEPVGPGGSPQEGGGTGGPHTGEMEVPPISPDARESITRYGFPLIEGEEVENPVIPDIMINETTSISGIWAVAFVFFLAGIIYAIFQRSRHAARGRRRKK